MFPIAHHAALLVLLVGTTGRMELCASELCLTVKDDAKLPLARAWVNVTDLIPSRTGDASPAKSYSASTDVRGRACLAVPEGAYSVEVGLTGFLNVRYYPVRVMFPNPVELSFQLPVGDVTEGGFVSEAILSGTLRLDRKPVDGAKICIWRRTPAALVTCGLTNVFGEYALSVPPGKYRTEVRTAQGKVYESELSVPSAGEYRHRIIMGEEKRNEQRSGKQ